MSDQAIPPGWPELVRPPGSPDWQDSAVLWLLDQVPPEYRRYDVLRRHPVLLARFAADHTTASLEAARVGWRTLRVDLASTLPTEAIDEAINAYEREGMRLAKVSQAVQLLGEALAGRRWVARL